jgi:peptidase E
MLNVPKTEINLLVISFARPEEEWDLPENEREKIIRLNPDKNITFQTASKEDILDQIDWADSIYIRGGRSDRDLLKSLQPAKKILNHLHGKIVAGSSAGLDVISKYFYNIDTDNIEEGLGILPIKAISHYGLPNQYGKDFEKEFEDLKNYKRRKF